MGPGLAGLCASQRVPVRPAVCAARGQLALVLPLTCSFQVFLAFLRNLVHRLAHEGVSMLSRRDVLIMRMRRPATG